MTVKCGDRTWNLHKNILCSRSVWFEKALTGSFEEAKTGVVEIHNFEPEPVDWLVRYIYSGSELNLDENREKRGRKQKEQTKKMTGKQIGKRLGKYRHMTAEMTVKTA